MHSNRQTMNQEPTAKRSRRDQDTSLANISGLTDEATPSTGDRLLDGTEHAQASYAHQVEYPQPIHAGLEQLYAQGSGAQATSYWPHMESAWTYPYAWSPGPVATGYGTEYQQSQYRALAQMANMRRHYIEDPISSTTLTPSSGPTTINDNITRPQSRMVPWEQVYQGPPPNVTIQPNDSLIRNIVIDVSLLSPDAHEVKATSGPRIPLFSAQKLKLRPFRTRAVRTDVYWEFPENTYGEIRTSGRERFHERGVEVLCQKVSHIPNDGISVLLHNASNEPYNISIGDDMGEIMILRVLQPIIRTQVKLDMKPDYKRERKQSKPTKTQPKK